MKHYQCGNCDFETDDADDLNLIEDVHVRVESGEIFPAGECPDCGCLVSGGDRDVIDAGNVPYIIGLLERQGYTVTKGETT